MGDTNYSNVVFLNNEAFDNNIQQLDSTALFLNLDKMAMQARENDCKGTDTIEYISDKIHFLSDVSNAYKDFIANNVETILVDSQDDINTACQVAGDKVSSGSGY